MARIVKTDIQEMALKAIKGNIRTLAGIDGVLGTGAERAQLTVTAGREKVSLEVRKPSGDNILRDIRRKMVAETLMLARRNAIELDEGDWAVLEGRTGGVTDLPDPERSGPISADGAGAVAGDRTGAGADEGAGAGAMAGAGRSSVEVIGGTGRSLAAEEPDG